MGERGPMGMQGAPGKDATSYRPSGYAFCELLLDLIGSNSQLGSDGITETYLEYDFTRFVNKDLNVACQGALGSAAASTGGSFYPSIAAGSSNGACLANVDYPPIAPPPGHVGRWEFDMASGLPRAVYKDPDAGHPLNGRSFTFGENDCHCFTMSATNQWQDAALSDVL